MSGEKTEKPTEQRKRQARREGQIPATPDLGAWSGILAASFLIPVVVTSLVQHITELMHQVGTIIKNPTQEAALKLLTTGAWDALLAVAPLCLGLLAISIAATAAQNGLRPAVKRLKPNFASLNPLSGLKRAFGGHALWETVKALLKTALLGVILYISVRNLVPALLTAGSLPLRTLLSAITSACLSMIRIAAVGGLVVAVGDYAVARRRVNKQIKMSKQDIKDEHKHTEGDPQLKSAIRSKQAAMARQRMMSDVPKADVVVVNPVHVAVALRYDPAKGAPRVVAKGAGAVAAKIREKASEHRIPLVEDIPLARALYRACDLGQEIPADFYEAVARVLAFVMMLKAKGSAAGLHRNVPGR